MLGNLFELNQEQGQKSIKDIVNHNLINQCKKGCRKEYPVEMPLPRPPVPKDPKLGTEKNPAASCMDIKQWGPPNAQSGLYYIELGAKGIQRVFCDMETDHGGWTLFFNYVHQPGQDVILNENKLPSDLKSNSHMSLHNAGFQTRDVKELRFFCTEIHKGVKKLWHFKSNNPDLLDVAMDGDQSVIKVK